MIKSIVRDTFFLGQKSEEATKNDLPVAIDSDWDSVLRALFSMIY